VGVLVGSIRLPGSVPNAVPDLGLLTFLAATPVLARSSRRSGTTDERLPTE
jgi:hypothetical protein